jgi:hypothetical protein
MNRLKRIMIIAALTAFSFSSLTASYVAAAEDSMCTIPNPTDPKICYDDFYSGNNILYYDPNAKDCVAPVATNPQPGTGGPLVGNSNAEKIFTFLTGKGLSSEQAAGVLGNFQQESGFDPAIIQGGAIADQNYRMVNGVGFGIAQWTFTARQGPLQSLATASSRGINDLSLQLDFLWQELNTTHARSLTSLKAETTPERAAYVFHRDFEGSADSEAAVIRVRGGNAVKLFEQYKNLAPGSPSTATPGCAPTATAPGTGSAKFLSADYTIYNQCQYPPYGGSWGTRLTPSGGTMCQNACIPTSLAMIAKSITGAAITPENTIDYYDKNNLWNPGFGSYNSSPLTAAGAFGLKVETVANKSVIESYKAVFDKGGQIMAISTGTAPFMPSRHAIVIRGITAEGNFMIGDPGRRETNTAPANQPTTNKILTDIRSDSASVVYAFYKQ